MISAAWPAVPGATTTSATLRPNASSFVQPYRVSANRFQ